MVACYFIYFVPELKKTLCFSMALGSFVYIFFDRFGYKFWPFMFLITGLFRTPITWTRKDIDISIWLIISLTSHLLYLYWYSCSSPTCASFLWCMFSPGNFVNHSLAIQVEYLCAGFWCYVYCIFDIIKQGHFYSFMQEWRYLSSTLW